MQPQSTLQKLPPVLFLKVLNAFRAFLIRLNRMLFPGNVVLYEQFQNFWLLPALYVAAKFNIASVLSEKALTSEEIAAKLALDPCNVARIMRALAGEGIFRQFRDGRFGLNGRSKGLLDERGSLRYMILHHLGPINWNLMSNLEYSVRTGQDAFTDKYGKPTYDFLKDHPSENLLFDKSMSNLSDLGLAPILQAYDFSKFKIVADIGGGEGFLLANILHYCPGTHGILFDSQNALEKAPELLSRYNALNRAEILPGNFFERIPVKADIYLLKNIIHNWSDIQSIELLCNIRKTMEPGAILLILEMVIPDNSGPSLAKLLDIQMMATMTGGKERTGLEYRDILDKSGFRLKRIIPTISPVSLIEATQK